MTLLLFFMVILLPSGVLTGMEVEGRKTLELFLAVGTTTSLMCEPIFSEEGTIATWYKDGEPIANATSKSNAFLPGRPYRSTQKVPEVGFLIVSDLRRDDEGDYECVDESTGKRGDISRLKVAYVHPLPVEGHIRVLQKKIELGSPLVLFCPLPDAKPVPSITWQLNGRPIHEAESSTFPNGTILLPKLQLRHLGVFTCTGGNFAGKTQSRILIDSKSLFVDRGDPSFTQRCSYFFRACLLWFLIGCLSTSCAFLLYLLIAMICCRPTRRLVMRPSSFLRPQASLGPGFRKAIVPLPDYYMAAPQNPPPNVPPPPYPQL